MIVSRRGLLASLLQAANGRTPVIFDHDAGLPDDFTALVMLLAMRNIDLRGVVVTPGVSFPVPAVSTTQKVLELAGKSSIPVAKSNARVLNPFPTEWRKKSFIADALPILNQSKRSFPLMSETGEHFLVRMLKQSSEPVVLLATGPLSTIAAALRLDSTIAKNIREIVWMGGALKVPGNVFSIEEPAHDGTAEWNAYCDPTAAWEVWQTSIPLMLCPLDATNKVPVTRHVLARLAALRSKPLADVVGQITAIAFSGAGEFFFWDALATAYLGKPDLFRVDEWEVALHADGVSQGRTVPQARARRVRAMEAKNPREFYDYFFSLLER